jgi:hypothetical protein
MGAIHDVIIDAVETALADAFMYDLPLDDISRAGVVRKGPLQGDPDPDEARISVTVHENDPDRYYGKQGTSESGTWDDEVKELECGGSITWARRFTVKARCLLVNTQEDLNTARQIASAVRSRIEYVLRHFTGMGLVADDGEYVSRGAFGSGLKGEMVQAGGPPNAYDYSIKCRFEIQTTTTGET